MDPTEEIKDFIWKLYEKPGGEFRHTFASPGGIEWAKDYWCDHMKGEFLPITCQCDCSGTDHEHAIFWTEMDPAKWDGRRDKWLEKMKRKGIKPPKKLAAYRSGNKSHIMNTVLYILGGSSINYRDGHTKHIRGAHRNHSHPFKSLPTDDQIQTIRKEMREEDPDLQQELEEWKGEMARKRKATKEFRAKQKRTGTASNRVAKRL